MPNDLRRYRIWYRVHGDAYDPFRMDVTYRAVANYERDQVFGNGWPWGYWPTHEVVVLSASATDAMLQFDIFLSNSNRPSDFHRCAIWPVLDADPVQPQVPSTARQIAFNHDDH